MFRNRRFFARGMLGLALAVVGLQAHAQPLTRVKLMIDWRFEGPSALFLLTKAKGYFEKEGLDVTVDPGTGGGVTVQRVVSGVYDIGVADMGSIIEFLANNANNPAARLQATFLLYERAPLTVFTMKKDGVTKPGDLAGKTLGAPVFDPGRRMFPIFAKVNGIDPASVKWTTMDPAMRETLLQRGDVQGITGFYFTSLLGLNARGVPDEQIATLKYADYGLQLYGNSVFATRKYLEENPKVMSGFLRALSRGIRDVVADPAQAVEHVKAREPLTDLNLERRRLVLAIESSIATPAVRANGFGAADPAVVSRMVQQVVDAYGLQSSPDAGTLFNSSFLPPLAERRLPD